jgi:hypothetical protein
MGIAVQLGLWVKHVCSVVRPIVSKVMEYYSMAAPIYAGWSIDTDIYYETATKCSITKSSKALVERI